MNIGIIAVVIMLTFLILITWACIFNNVCIGCNEPTTRCKSCKHYGPPLVTSNYEPKEEDEMKEVDFLAKRINALDDDEFFQLSKLVTRGYENGRD